MRAACVCLRAYMRTQEHAHRSLKYKIRDMY